MQHREATDLSSDQRRLRVDEYHAMINAGIFDEDESLELLQGVLCTMSPQDVAHAQAIQLLTHLFARGLPDRYYVRVQLPLTIGPDSEPEPDLAIVDREAGLDPGRHPSRALLVIEVVSTSLERDRTIKAPLYARGGIPEYWIVNLVDQRLEVHRKPLSNEATYEEQTAHHPADELHAEAFPELTIRVSDLLPTNL